MKKKKRKKENRNQFESCEWIFFITNQEPIHWFHIFNDRVYWIKHCSTHKNHFFVIKISEKLTTSHISKRKMLQLWFRLDIILINPVVSSGAVWWCTCTYSKVLKIKHWNGSIYYRDWQRFIYQKIWLQNRKKWKFSQFETTF